MKQSPQKRPEQPGRPFYSRGWLMWLCLPLFPPASFILLWTAHPKLGTAVKALLSALFLSAFVAWLGGLLFLLSGALSGDGGGGPAPTPRAIATPWPVGTPTPAPTPEPTPEPTPQPTAAPEEFYDFPRASIELHITPEPLPTGVIEFVSARGLPAPEPLGSFLEEKNQKTCGE